jgi:hypothetical protein
MREGNLQKQIKFRATEKIRRNKQESGKFQGRNKFMLKREALIM